MSQLLAALLTALSLTMVSAPAVAQSSYSAAIRWGSQLLRTGDGEGRILTVTGRPPDRIVPVENRFGARLGERWVYYELAGINPRTVQLELVNGQIERLWVERVQR
jgi:hypothetical protein